MSVTAVDGFVAAGGSAGIKAAGAPDVAIVATADGAAVSAAGVFTGNLAAAAPVQISRLHLQKTGGQASAVILTSGNANAATGEPGRQAVRQLCKSVADGLGAQPEEVLACQTGLIGIPFPIEVALPALPSIVASRSANAQAGAAAARAIMTTDTVPKEVVVHGDGFTVGGMAKGAAMLAPNMATMLAVCITDAAVDPDTLRTCLQQAVAASFNLMTVDGCTSTNDTVLVLANGHGSTPTPDALAAALTEACQSLAEQMVSDAEGATKMAHIKVVGAESDAAAHTAARKVADSQLVQCSLNGEDPYWGRVISELGSAGVAFDIDQVSVAYGGTVVCAGGVAAAHDEAAVIAHMQGRHIEILCDLQLGSGRAAVLTTDLGYGYIDENRTTFVSAAVPESTASPAGVSPPPKVTRAQRAAAQNTASVLVEALPYIHRFSGKVVVVKYGGNALNGSAGGADAALAAFAQDVVLMRAVGMLPVVVHGGGPQIGELMTRLGKVTEFRDGLRVTDAETLDIARMVLVGKINRDIVSAINVHGPFAVGMSGEDANLITAHQTDVDLGFVGSVSVVDPTILQRLLSEGIIPVVATIGADEAGQSYNINADTVAGALAEALGAEKLVFLTDIEGLRIVPDDPATVIHRASAEVIDEIVRSGGAEGGMKPKVEACARAVRAGVTAAHILDGRVSHAILLELFTDSGVGTMVLA